MSNSEEYNAIRLDFQRLITECQETRRDKGAKLEVHRLKVSQEIRALRKDRERFNDEWDKKVRDVRLYGIQGKPTNKLENQDSNDTFYSDSDPFADVPSSFQELGRNVHQSIQVSYCLRDLMRIDSLQKITRIHERAGTTSQMDQSILELLTNQPE